MGAMLTIKVRYGRLAHLLRPKLENASTLGCSVESILVYLGRHGEVSDCLSGHGVKLRIRQTRSGWVVTVHGYAADYSDVVRWAHDRLIRTPVEIWRNGRIVERIAA